MSRFARRARPAVVIAALLAAGGARAQAFDFDNGNAILQVVIPQSQGTLSGAVGPGDASLILRVTTISTTAWFDAIAPYHPTAVGIYSRLGRRPASEAATNRNKNIAILYASLHVLNSVFPHDKPAWRAMMQSVGLDPDDASTDLSTAAGIGNAAGAAVVRVREHDGMNQLGDAGGRRYNLKPFADTLGYQPINTADELIDRAGGSRRSPPRAPGCSARRSSSPRSGA